MDIEKINVEQEIGKVGAHICEHDKKKGLLIPILHRIQEDYGYLPGEALERLSKKLELPLAEIYSVASFYHQFHFSPRGKKIVRVCMGTACHVRGASKVLEELKRHFKIDVGETTEDLTMTLETVGCVGCCGLAPVATINDDVVGEVGKNKIPELIEAIEKEEVDVE
ncbi:MAG: NADH-quinone oxidoreductase subunit NuoE [Nitrospirae bacterium]|nr:MAG: NADH-quinone oxidoreductase subunit NuoE [Nitrospirota bacterium]